MQITTPPKEGLFEEWLKEVHPQHLNNLEDYKHLDFADMQDFAYWIKQRVPTRALVEREARSLSHKANKDIPYKSGLVEVANVYIAWENGFVEGAMWARKQILGRY